MSWLDQKQIHTQPHKVLIKRDEFTDHSREGRVLPFKVYYPVDHNYDTLPIVFWSHGLGGSREGAGFLVRALASHGYIVVNTQHPGTDSSLWQGKPEHPWDAIRKAHIPRSATLDRPQDISFILDNLEPWLSEIEQVGDLADFDNVGMSGHSFGALTAQMILGQKFPDEDDELRSFSDNRFKAGIAYSPVPIHTMTDKADQDIYSSIDRPLLHMTGTNDDSPLSGYGYEERLRVKNHAGNQQQYLSLLQGGDHMVYAGSRGQLAENPNREQHEAIITELTIAFWDGYLKGDKDALLHLKSQTI